MTSERYLMMVPEKTDMKWGPGDILGVVLLGIFVLWIALPTRIFLDVRDLTIDGREVQFVRLTPFGSVQARWQSEIFVSDGTGFECSSGKWQIARYQAIPSSTITYTLGDWAVPCLERNAHYTLTTSRNVLFFGVIPLRSSKTIHTIEVKNAS